MEDGIPRSPLGLRGKWEELADVKRLVLVLWCLEVLRYPSPFWIVSPIFYYIENRL